MAKTVLLFVLALAVSATAQTGPLQNSLIPPHSLTVNTVLFGHSWVWLMQGFQPWAFPNLPSRHIAIDGYPGYTCQQLLPLVSSDIPATTNAVFVIAATNDIIQYVPVDTHIACMKTMIGEIIAQNPHILILLSNVPPFSPASLQYIPDKRSVVAAYNQAYAGLPALYPNNVVLVDMWTPLVDTAGWGLSTILDYGDGIHFGPNGRFAVMGVIRDALYSGLAQYQP
jgi:hypothetical protein